jgi:hypothetical protein
MPFIPKARQVLWTRHAQAKMAFYKLSEQRVVRVMHSPKRIEEGVAPKTVAMMQPASIKTAASRPTFAKKVDATSKKETWSQEIWVMVQDLGKQRKIISAWRYPGMTKPRSEDSLDLLRREYREFLAGKK